MFVPNSVHLLCFILWTSVLRVLGDMEKPGKCPPWAGTGTCITSCNNDWDCSGLQKCCSIQCGRMCLDPCSKSCNNVNCVNDKVCQVIDGCGQCVTGSAKPAQPTGDKPGTCMPWNGPGPCVKNCVGDNNCPGDKKCCKIGCGRLCQDPCQTTCTWNCISGRECKLIDGCAQCVPVQ